MREIIRDTRDPGFDRELGFWQSRTIRMRPKDTDFFPIYGINQENIPEVLDRFNQIANGADFGRPNKLAMIYPAAHPSRLVRSYMLTSSGGMELGCSADTVAAHLTRRGHRIVDLSYLQDFSRP